MYRIVKETNLLTSRTVYIIERYRKFLWWGWWTRDLGLDVEIYGGIVSSRTLGGAVDQLEIIKSGSIITIEETKAE